MRRLVLLVLILLAAVPAHAADQPLPAPGEPLEPRQAARSGYAPQGLRLGAVTLFPEVDLRRGYREEIFAMGEGATRRGWVSTAAARLRAEATEGPWGAALRADVERATGPQTFVGDGVQGGGALDLRLGLGRIAVADAEAGWQHRLEPRIAPEVAGQAAEPVPVSTAHAAAGLRTAHAVFTGALRAEVQRLSFGDVPRLGSFNGAPLPTETNGDRDRTKAMLAGEIAWRPGGVSALYVRGSVADIDYARDADDGGFRRDAATHELLAGVALGRPEDWRLFLEVGRIGRSSSDPRMPAVSALAVNAGATVAVTPLVTAQVAGETLVAETTRAGVPAVLVRRGTLEIEHEVLRSVILLTTGEVAWHHYVDDDRDDIAFSYGGGVRWRIGPLARVELMLRQDSLNTEVEAERWQAVEATLRLAARF